MHFVKESPLRASVQQRLRVRATPLQLALDIGKLFQPFNFHRDIHGFGFLVFESFWSRQVSLFLVDAWFANLRGIRINVVIQKGHLVHSFSVSTHSWLLRARSRDTIIISFAHTHELPISIHVVKVSVSLWLFTFFSWKIESWINVRVVDASYLVLVVFSILFKSWPWFLKLEGRRIYLLFVKIILFCNFWELQTLKMNFGLLLWHLNFIDHSSKASVVLFRLFWNLIFVSFDLSRSSSWIVFDFRQFRIPLEDFGLQFSPEILLLQPPLLRSHCVFVTMVHY